MTTGQLITIIAVILILVLLFLFPELRTLLKGFVRIFIKDMAATPEGAKAIYEEKIQEVQDNFNKADEVYKTTAGKLEIEKDKLKKYKSKLKKIESECETLVKSNHFEEAELKSEEREAILGDIARTEKLVEELNAATKAAENAYKLCEKNLRNLEKEARDTVEDMKLKETLKDVYDDMDTLKKVSGSDKMLSSVREHKKNLDARVEGARVVHENKLSTKIEKAEEKAAKLQSNDYIESLKKKYNK